MGNDTKPPADPHAPPEGLRVVPIDLETLLVRILAGRHMPEVMNATFFLLGSVFACMREIEAGKREDEDLTPAQHDQEWAAVKGEMIQLLESAKAILIDEDWQAAHERYTQLGLRQAHERVM